MSLEKNTISNYTSRIYFSLIGVIIFPFYLRYLGAEAFGLISLFAVMQSWLRIFDMGLMPALSREVAYYRSQNNGFVIIRQLLRTLEIIFLVFNIIIFICVIFYSQWIAHHWLKIEKLDYKEVSSCIVIMVMMINLHWFSDLYRAGIIGMEKQVWLNSVNVIIVTLQYVGGYIMVSAISTMPIYFFCYQIAVSGLEFLILGITFYKVIPASSFSFWSLNISSELIKRVLPFAWGISYTAILWTLSVETDKLLLSHILSLSTYGYFALVMMILGGIMQFSAPLSEAILPRMTNLFSQGNKKEMLQLYRNATQIMAVTMLTLNGVVAIFGTELVYAWTGNKMAAAWAGPVLFWYSLGNGLLSISAFQFYLQYAYGKLKLQVILNTLFTMVTIPLIAFSAFRWGALGTGIVWFLTQSVIFLIIPPIIHRKYAPGVHRDWLLKDVLPILITIVMALLCIKTISINFSLMNRTESFAIFGGLITVVLIIGSLASSTCRGSMGNFFKSRG